MFLMFTHDDARRNTVIRARRFANYKRGTSAQEFLEKEYARNMGASYTMNYDVRNLKFVAMFPTKEEATLRKEQFKKGTWKPRVRSAQGPVQPVEVAPVLMLPAPEEPAVEPSTTLEEMIQMADEAVTA